MCLTNLFHFSFRKILCFVLTKVGSWEVNDDIVSADTLASTDIPKVKLSDLRVIINEDRLARLLPALCICITSPIVTVYFLFSIMCTVKKQYCYIYFNPLGKFQKWIVLIKFLSYCLLKMCIFNKMVSMILIINRIINGLTCHKISWLISPSVFRFWANF